VSLKNLINGAFNIGLKKKLSATLDKLRDKDDRLQKQIAYRDKLLSQIESLKASNARQKEKISSQIEYQKLLLGRIENLKGYQHAGIDTIEHNSKAGMDMFFEKISNAQPYTEFGKSLRALIDKLDISLDGISIADVGVGPGIALSALLKNSYPSSVHGFDFSQVALSYARQEIENGVFTCHDIYVPLEQKFDVVLCTEVLEHLENPNLAYKNLQQAVKEGGCLLIAVPNGRMDRSAYHINFWSPESWETFIREGCDLDSWEVGAFTSSEDRIDNNNFALIKA